MYSAHHAGKGTKRNVNKQKMTLAGVSNVHYTQKAKNSHFPPGSRMDHLKRRAFNSMDVIVKMMVSLYILGLTESCFFFAFFEAISLV